MFPLMKKICPLMLLILWYCLQSFVSGSTLKIKILLDDLTMSAFSKARYMSPRSADVIFSNWMSSKASALAVVA